MSILVNKFLNNYFRESNNLSDVVTKANELVKGCTLMDAISLINDHEDELDPQLVSDIGVTDNILTSDHSNFYDTASDCISSCFSSEDDFEEYADSDSHCTEIWELADDEIVQNIEYDEETNTYKTILAVTDSDLCSKLFDQYSD